jgi:hypothetical protein
MVCNHIYDHMARVARVCRWAVPSLGCPTLPCFRLLDRKNKLAGYRSFILYGRALSPNGCPSVPPGVWAVCPLEFGKVLYWQQSNISPVSAPSALPSRTASETVLERTGRPGPNGERGWPPSCRPTARRLPPSSGKPRQREPPGPLKQLRQTVQPGPDGGARLPPYFQAELRLSPEGALATFGVYLGPLPVITATEKRPPGKNKHHPEAVGKY